MHPRSLQLVTAALLACVGTSAQAQKAPPSSSPVSVAIEIGGVVAGHAREMRGQNTAAVVETPKGAGNAVVNKHPPGSDSKSDNLELLGLDPQALNAFTQWSRAGSAGALPKEVKLTPVNYAGKPMEAYLLHNARLKSLSAGGMNAKSSQDASARVTLTYEGISPITAGGGE